MTSLALASPSIWSRRSLALAAAALTMAATSASAQSAPPATLPGPTYTEALGIGLEGWPYPAPVRFFEVAGPSGPLRMAYMDVPPSGPANGRTVVLLHGKNFDGSYWAGPIAALAAMGFRVVAPDQIGFNKSAKPDQAYRFEDLAANTAALLDALKVGTIDLLGHSTGGMLAVRFARLYPARVAHLVLEDPLGLEDYGKLATAPDPAALLKAELDQTTPGYRAFMSHYFPILPPQAYEPFVAWRARVALSGEYERWARASADLYQMIYAQPVVAEFPALSMPVLLLVGEKDRTAPFRALAPPDVARTMGDIPALARRDCSAMPQCSLVVVPGVGHVPHLEAPQAFETALRTFLN